MKSILSPKWPKRNYTPSDAVYDWSVGKEFMSSTHGIIHIGQSDRLVAEGVDLLVFTCGGSSTTLSLGAQDRPSGLFNSDGIFHTDECEARRKSFRYTGRDEPLYRPDYGRD